MSNWRRCTEEYVLGEIDLKPETEDKHNVGSWCVTQSFEISPSGQMVLKFDFNFPKVNFLSTRFSEECLLSLLNELRIR
jgi:hypothetical protein